MLTLCIVVVAPRFRGEKTTRGGPRCIGERFLNMRKNKLTRMFFACWLLGAVWSVWRFHEPYGSGVSTPSQLNSLRDIDCRRC